MADFKGRDHDFAKIDEDTLLSDGAIKSGEMSPLSGTVRQPNQQDDPQQRGEPGAPNSSLACSVTASGVASRWDSTACSRRESSGPANSHGAVNAKLLLEIEKKLGGTAQAQTTAADSGSALATPTTKKSRSVTIGGLQDALADSANAGEGSETQQLRAPRSTKVIQGAVEYDNEDDLPSGICPSALQRKLETTEAGDDDIKDLPPDRSESMVSRDGVPKAPLPTKVIVMSGIDFDDEEGCVLNVSNVKDMESEDGAASIPVSGAVSPGGTKRKPRPPAPTRCNTLALAPSPAAPSSARVSIQPGDADSFGGQPGNYEHFEDSMSPTGARSPAPGTRAKLGKGGLSKEELKAPGFDDDILGRSRSKDDAGLRDGVRAPKTTVKLSKGALAAVCVDDDDEDADADIEFVADPVKAPANLAGGIDVNFATYLHRKLENELDAEDEEDALMAAERGPRAPKPTQTFSKELQTSVETIAAKEVVEETLTAKAVDALSQQLGLADDSLCEGELETALKRRLAQKLMERTDDGDDASSDAGIDLQTAPSGGWRAPKTTVVLDSSVMMDIAAGIDDDEDDGMDPQPSGAELQRALSERLVEPRYKSEEQASPSSQPGRRGPQSFSSRLQSLSKDELRSENAQLREEVERIRAELRARAAKSSPKP